MNIASVILAAGQGTRMESALPKVLHSVMGRPLIDWSVSVTEPLCEGKPIVVVGHGRDEVQAFLGSRVQYAVQEEQLGTGHAVQQTVDLLHGKADAVVVTYGDMPLLQQDTLASLLDLYRSASVDGNLALAMLTVTRNDPQGFGRILRNSAGEITAVVEEADCTPEQQQIRELNPGIYCFNAEWLWKNLASIPVSAKGEYYLTDMVGIASQQGRRVVSTSAPVEDVNGINTRVHLASATEIMRRRINERHMHNGVTFIDPASTYIDDSVSIERDTIIMPGSILQGATSIGANCIIGPYSQIVDSSIGDASRVIYSVLEKAEVGNETSIGPFGRLRPGAHLDDHVHMGSFGEVKNSHLAAHVHMGHFSYIGDSEVGQYVNIGAGTITCNYDGLQKHQTVIGEHAFIGSDTLIVAPIEIGERARTGAGSVVTRDVEDDMLVYGVPARPAKTDERDDHT